MTRAWLVVMLLAGSARADDKTEQAKALYAEGKRYYDVAEYGKAIEAWKSAYVAAPSPILLFNIGQAYRLSGDCKQALVFYASYEREQPTPPNQQELTEAKARCTDKPPDRPPPPPPVDSKPPVDTTSQLRQVELDDRRPSVPPPPPVEDNAGTFKTVGLATGATGVVLVGLGLYLGSVARSDAHAVETATTWTPTLEDTQNSGKTASTWSVVTTVAGVTAIGGGIALYYLGVQASHHTDVAIAPGRVEVVWYARF